jgi:hypothetical protein
VSHTLQLRRETWGVELVAGVGSGDASYSFCSAIEDLVMVPNQHGSSCEDVAMQGLLAIDFEIQ